MFLYCVLALAVVSSSSAFVLKDPRITREPSKSPGYGGKNGAAFDDLEFNSGQIIGIHSINISFGDYIDAIQVMYLLSDGSLHLAPVHGKVADTPINITLGYEEYVSKVEGKVYNNSDGKVELIGQLTITTAAPGYVHKVYGPFGRIGSSVNFTEEGYIFGFHGRSGDGLDNVGVYSLPALNQSKDYGGHGGELFDDLEGKNASVVAITSIKIWHAEQIGALQVEYLLFDGMNIVGELHGKITDNLELTTITFDKGERLQRINGLTGDYYVDMIISLTTMKEGNIEARYGPFGKTGKYQFVITAGNILGFFGSSDSMIDRLGVHFIP